MTPNQSTYLCFLILTNSFEDVFEKIYVKSKFLDAATKYSKYEKLQGSKKVVLI